MGVFQLESGGMTETCRRYGIRKIDDIIDRQEDELEDYWESRMPEIRTVLDGTYAEIRALLDPSQQQQFDRKVASLGGQIPVEFRD